MRWRIGKATQLLMPVRRFLMLLAIQRQAIVEQASIKQFIGNMRNNRLNQ